MPIALEDLTIEDKTFLTKCANSGVPVDQAFMELENQKNKRGLGTKIGADVGVLPTPGEAPSLVERGIETVGQAAETMAGKPLGDIMRGGAKAITGAVKGAAALQEKGMRAVMPEKIETAVLGTPGEVTVAEELIPEETLKAEGAAEQIGKIGMDLAMFVAPSGLITKGGKILESSKLLASIPTKLQGTAKLLGLGGMEGLSFAGVEAIQKGEVTKDTVNSFLLGAAMPFAGAGAEKGLAYVDEILKTKVGPAMLKRLIKPAKKEYLFGKDPVKAITEEGIVARSLDDLLTQVKSNKSNVGAEIGGKLKASGKELDMSSAVNSIDDLMKNAIEGGEQTLYNRLADIKRGLTDTFELVNGKIISTGKRPMIVGAEEAHKIKQSLGSASKWTGQAFDAEANQARVNIYRGLNDLIDKTVPGVKALQSRYANLLGAEKSVENRVLSNASKFMPGLKEMFTFGAATMASPALAATGLVAERVLASTAARTKIAQGISPAIKGAVVSPETRAAALGAISELRR